MSRATQYIGLTEDAKVFIGNMFEKRRVMTEGLFGEDVYGGVWDDRYQEEVQFALWSQHGPTIFTFLSDSETGAKLFTWDLDMELEEEYDRFAGTYNVSKIV